MKVTIERGQPADFPAVLALVDAAGLPVAGLAPHEVALLVARAGAAVVGSAALEVYGARALLRSVAVAASFRGRGLGQRLTTAALDLARGQGVHDVYLLTETAQAFFPRLGFAPVAREDVDPAIHQSIEWSSACPASAQALVRHLAPGPTPAGATERSVRQ